MNKLKLKGAIAEKGITQGKLAEILEMSQKTLSNKINGKSIFTVPEAHKICDTLNIENPREIFFT